jgi:hypothetical protein
MVRKGLSLSVSFLPLAECSRMSACIIYSIKRFDTTTVFFQKQKNKNVYSKFGVCGFSVFMYSLIHPFIHCNCKSLIYLQPVYTMCTVITKTYYTEAILTQGAACNGMAI